MNGNVVLGYQTGKFSITEAMRLISSFLLCVFLVYFLPRMGVPQIAIRTAFILWILYVFSSKDDVYWLAWYFIIINSPGRLFLSTTSETVYRLPMYTIISGISLGFTEMFAILYFIKYLMTRKDSLLWLKKITILILLFGVVSLVYSFVLGMSLSSLVFAVRSIIPWLWMLIFPALIDVPEKMDRFFFLISPFAIFGFLVSLHAQITGYYLHNILSGESRFRYLGDFEEGLVRVGHAPHLFYICTLFALFYISIHSKKFDKGYLNVVVVLSVLSIVMTAARGWIIGIAVLLLSIMFLRRLHFIKNILSITSMTILAIFIIGMFYPQFSNQLSLAYERFSTVEEIAAGDLTAGGTLSRITERGPRVMSMFRESPVIGWGFSDVFRTYSDNHVGNYNILLQGGIIGFWIWMYSYLVILFTSFRISTSHYMVARIGNAGILVVLALLGSFSVHSSSMQMWGFFGSSQVNVVHWILILSPITVYSKSSIITNYSTSSE